MIFSFTPRVSDFGLIGSWLECWLYLQGAALLRIRLCRALKLQKMLEAFERGEMEVGQRQPALFVPVDDDGIGSLANFSRLITRNPCSFI